MPLSATEARPWTGAAAFGRVKVRARAVAAIALIAQIAFGAAEGPLRTRPEVAAAARTVFEPTRTPAGPESRATREVVALAAAMLARAAGTVLSPLATFPAVTRPAVVAVARPAMRPRASIESPLVVMIWQVDVRSFESAPPTAGSGA